MTDTDSEGLEAEIARLREILTRIAGAADEWNEATTSRDRLAAKQRLRRLIDEGLQRTFDQ